MEMENSQVENVDYLEPWIRFCARSMDIFLYSIFYYFLWLVLPDSLLLHNLFSLVIVCIGLEIVCLSIWKNTLGKAFAGIVLQPKDGTDFNIWMVCKRTISVWVKGMAFGLPLVSLLTMWVARKKLINSGNTDWDERYGIIVKCRIYPQWWRKVVLGISSILFIFFYLVIYIAILDFFAYRSASIQSKSISSIQKLYDNNQLDEALLEVDRYLEKHTRAQIALNLKGCILVEQGKNEEAITYFLQAVEQDVSFGVGYNNLSWAYNNLCLYKIADNYATRALKLEPSDYDANINKGNALFGMEKYDEAMKYFDIALENNPKRATAYWGKGLTYYVQKDYKKSVEYMKKYNQFCSPDEVKNTDFYIPSAYKMLGDYQGAIDEYKIQIARPTNDYRGEVYLRLGDVYQKIQKYESAITCYDQAISSNLHSGEAYYGKSLSLIALGQKEAALDYLSTAIKYDEEFREEAKDESSFDDLRSDWRFAEIIK